MKHSLSRKNLTLFLLATLSFGSLFFTLSGALALGPAISAMTFAGKTGSVVDGGTINFDLSGVSDSDLAAPGSITVSEASTLNITSPEGSQISNLALASGVNNVSTVDIFGYNILASELQGTAIAAGGLIPVQGTLTNLGNEVTNVNINISYDIVAPAISAMTFAGKTGSVVDGGTINFDLSGVSDSDLAAPGSITVSEASTLNITSPEGSQISNLALASGVNNVSTVDIFGYNILASELQGTAIAAGGLIPVQGTLADAYGNIRNIAINITYDDVAKAFDTLSAVLVSVGIDNNLDTVTGVNYNNFSGLYFEKTGLGRITFNDALDLSDPATQTYLYGLQSKIDITGGKIGLNAIGSSLVGKAASVKFYGTNSLGIPDSATAEEISNYIVARDDSGNIIDKATLVSNPVFTGACEVFKPECQTFSFDVGHFTSFEIDNVPPEVDSIEAKTLLNEADAATTIYNVIVNYNEPMDQAVNPTIAYTPAPARLQAGTCSGHWVSGTQYIFPCNLYDDNEEIANIEIEIIGAKDLVGNVQAEAEYLNYLTIDTIAPVVTINTYDTAPTNQDLTVTANTNEGALSVSSHTFALNSNFDFVATDAAGNSSTVNVAISNIDKTVPVISLIGANPQIIEAGTVYTELGASVADNQALSAMIDASNVNTSIVNIYSVTYDATDAAGNSAVQIIRSVNVVVPATAQAVINQIAALPATSTMVLADKAAIVAARAAYESLTAEQKTFVTNLAVLTEAEANMAALEALSTAVATDRAALTEALIKGANANLANVILPLAALPLTGANGSAISWLSGSSSIVSNDGQTINRPTFNDGDATVALTASLTKGAISDTKTFALTILKLNATQLTPITAPDGSGDVTLSSTSSEVVITNPAQIVDVIIGSDAINPTLDLSSFITNGTGTLPAINIISNNAYSTLIAIPANTVVVSASTTWSGVMNAPIMTTVTLPTTAGQTKTLSHALELGFPGVKLTFDKAVRILFSGEAARRVGYSRAGSDFVEITNNCVADDQAAGNALPAEGDCRIVVGSDLIVWTKHFTTFATYAQAANPASSGSSGGSGYLPTAYCSNVTYGEWGGCVNGVQFRNVLSQSPTSCSLTTSQQAERSRSCSVAGILEKTGTTTDSETPVVTKVLGEKIYAEGTIIRKPDNRMYIILNGTEVYIRNLGELRSYVARFKKVIYANGTLIRRGGKDIYVIKNGKEVHIENLIELRKYAGKRIIDLNK